MKTIIITGASSGIGKATVELLEKEGNKLILVARSEDKLNELANEKENVFDKFVRNVERCFSFWSLRVKCCRKEN